MELKHQYGGATRDGVFAAMPPLEGMRLLLSYVASRQNRTSSCSSTYPRPIYTQMS